MMIAYQPDACPKCGSANEGYRYTIMCERIVEGEWGSGESHWIDEHETSISLVECVGCGERFRFGRLRDMGLVK